MVNRPEYDEDVDSTFMVWRKGGSEADARPYINWCARNAAQVCALDDWKAGETNWPATYCTIDDLTGERCEVDVTLAMQPTFIGQDIRVIPMPPATHVLWGDKVLCKEKRLRGVPSEWPFGQQHITLAAIADGAEQPGDRCEGCWSKVFELVTQIRQMGVWR